MFLSFICYNQEVLRTRDHPNFLKSTKFKVITQNQVEGYWTLHKEATGEQSDQKEPKQFALFAKNGLLDKEDHKSDPSMAAVNHDYTVRLLE